MLELVQDLWTVEAQAVVITTNGSVKQNGECVMGRGCAREARDRFPGLALALGKKIRAAGNHVQVIHVNPYIISFPVKHHWWEKADILLIERSCQELVHLTNLMQWQKVVLPRPGAGNGGLDYADVRPILAKYLDDRFIVVTK